MMALMTKQKAFTYKIERYLQLIRHGRQRPDLVTPDVIYKLSLMALDELAFRFLEFYETRAEDVGTLALLEQVQRIVYFNDRWIEELTAIIEERDLQVKEGRIPTGITAAQAQRVYENVLQVYADLNPYLPA